MKPISPYTQKMLRIEAFMKVLLAASALLIITALMVLIGYLSFRGLFIRHEIRSAVMPDYREEFPWPAAPNTEISEKLPEELQGPQKLWLSPSVTLGKMRADKLHDILSGKEKNWVGLAESSEKLRLLLSEAQVQSIQKQAPDWSQARNIEVLPNTEAVAQALLETPGALAILPAAWNHSNWPPTKTKAEAKRLPRSVSLADRSLLMRVSTEKAQGKEASETDEAETLKLSFDEAQALLEDSPEQVEIANYNWISGTVAQGTAAQGIALRPVELDYREYDILKLSFLLEAPAKNGKVGGISSLLLSSIILIVSSLLWAIPLGLAVAVFLAEYAEAPHKRKTGEGKAGEAKSAQAKAKQKNRLRFPDFINISIQTLSGIPSIIFGLFGSILFVPFFGISLLSGAATLVLMLLPTIILTAREALLTVPRSYIEGSLGLGAQKWYTILHISIPSALPGILAGIILAIGRALGETAALIYTLGTGYQAALSRFPQLLNDWPVLWQEFWLHPSLAKIVQVVQDYPLVDLHSSLRSISLHLYWMTINGISLQKGFSTAFVLIFMIVLLNMGARRLLLRFSTQTHSEH